MSRIADAIIEAIRAQEIPPPPGLGPDEFVQQFEQQDIRPHEWSAAIAALWRRTEDQRALTVALTAAERYANEARDITRRTAEQLTRMESRVQALDGLVRPLFDTPDAPETRLWEWRNLWAFWQFVPGTIRPRVLLTLWTFKDWWVIGVAMFLLGSWAPWQAVMALGALLVLSVAGFVAHELWMRWWGIRICQLEEADPHEYSMTFTPTFERFVSRYMH
mgnify:CR=1 FL=1